MRSCAHALLTLAVTLHLISCTANTSTVPLESTDLSDPSWVGREVTLHLHSGDTVKGAVEAGDADRVKVDGAWYSDADVATMEVKEEPAPEVEGGTHFLLFIILIPAAVIGAIALASS